MTKVMFRQYEHGEITALLPNVSGDPEGKTCVAYAAAGGFYFADVDAVMGNTKPAPKNKIARLKKALAGAAEIDHLTVVDDKPDGHEAARTADITAFEKFDRVVRAHAHR